MAKEFPKNVFVKKSKYGTKVSFKVDDFIAELQAKKDSSGWARIDINSKKANPEELYASWDDWKPDPAYKGEGQAQRPSTPAPRQSGSSPAGYSNPIADDLPF